MYVVCFEFHKPSASPHVVTVGYASLDADETRLDCGQTQSQPVSVELIVITITALNALPTITIAHSGITVTI